MRMRWLPVLILPLAACTSGEDMALLHREITDVQRQVQRLEASSLGKGDLTAMERRMAELTTQTMRSNADLATRVAELQERIEALHSSLETTTRRLQDISQQLAQTRVQPLTATLPPVTAGEPPTPVGDNTGGAPASPLQPPATPAATSPDELYRSSYEDYMRGNYDLAAQGFAEYLRRWPGTDLSDNAQYWIGECYDALGRNDDAIAAFSAVLDGYPTSDKAAAAQLKKGLLYLKVGDQGQGVVHLQYVVYEHPGTNEADLARDKLRSLGLTIR